MMPDSTSDITDLIDLGYSKMARAYQKDKKKEHTTEYLQWQKEAAIYLRISSDMQRDGFSLDAQELECKRYIEREGYHLCEENIYIDEAFSAKNEDRPAFKKMMLAAHLQKFSLLVIHKMDRFERNYANHDKTVKIFRIKEGKSKIKIRASIFLVSTIFYLWLTS